MFINQGVLAKTGLPGIRIMCPSSRVLEESANTIFTNLIKIRSLTCHPLMMCHDVGDLRKSNYGSHASVHIFHPMKMGLRDCENVIKLLCSDIKG
jgi:hypothetical protein